ncbi:MAG: hypothetical protein PHO40_06555 [Candidatus Omnitrophica bacterium]|jgi:hypothetical protein|nr:hypothetical protein [Candidatus Omnitrophota bacterium]
MKEDIKSKLELFLNDRIPFREECCVVYLMVELRKILDYLNSNEYPTLKFYCDWTVHIDLDRSEEIRNFMYSIEQSIEKEESTLDFAVELSVLKNQMEHLFKNESLPGSIFENNNWLKFRDLLLKILIDQPIKGLKFGCNISEAYFCRRNNDGVPVLVANFDNNKSRCFIVYR